MISSSGQDGTEQVVGFLVYYDGFCLQQAASELPPARKPRHGEKEFKGG
jgi:hypothetical protein